MYVCDISLLHGSECVPIITKLVICFRHKPIKMAKKLMVFRPPFGLHNEYEGNFKGGVSLLIVVRSGRKLWFQWPRPHALGGSWGIYLAVKPEIVGVAGANMPWGHFVCPSSSQKRESTAFDLILRSAWEISSPVKQVGRGSTLCRKRSQVWGRESEPWQKYMQ